MHGSPGAAAWHDEHVHFGRLLDLLDLGIERLAGGQRAAAAPALEIIEYLREYSDRYHHPREDAAFAILERRMPRLGPQFARLREQHGVIAQAGERLERQIRTMAGGSAAARAAELAAAAKLYGLYYRHHIATEETEAVWRAARTLTADEWQAVVDSVPVVFDPRFGATPRERYRGMLQSLEATL